MIGGLSAATGMVVVESVALAITISNDLVMPLLLRRRGAQAPAARATSARWCCGCGGSRSSACWRWASPMSASPAKTGLVSIGLLSFAAVAQIAPAFLGGLFWRRGTARGAIAGMTAGSLAWVYLLLLPSIRPGTGARGLSRARAAGDRLAEPGRARRLRAQRAGRRRGPVAAANVAAFVAFSLTRQPSALERTQASAFAGGAPAASRRRSACGARRRRRANSRRRWRAISARGGRAAPSQPSCANAASTTIPRSRRARNSIRHAEFLLSPAIGASTSRQVLSLLLRPRTVSGQSALKLIDEASAAIQSNRDQLQHALDHARQGITVFDANLALTAWNREFADLFDLPPAMLRHGVGLDEIVRFNAGRGAYGPGDSEDFVAERVASLLYDDQPSRLRLFSTQRVIEVRSARLPDGGIVTTYTDVTQTVQTEEALEAANEMLERRVDERTAELQRLNAELERAKNEARRRQPLEDAVPRRGEPRHPAAAQRRAALRELAGRGRRAGSTPRSAANLARNVDVSLEAVEEILGALLDISRLDAGATRPEISDVPVADLMRMLEIEFAPIARAKGLELVFVPTTLAIRTDRRLMRRLLQNLVSNAIKYTLSGRVLVGCRRRGGALRIEVWDTGIGIPPEQERAVFDEFQRLDQGARVARGLGPRPVDRRAAGAGARACRRPALAPGQGLGVLRHRAARRAHAQAPRWSAARPSRSRRASRSTG